MLTIVGPPKRKKNYTNVPMHDGAGKVTAFLRGDHVNYRPLGGSAGTRRVRAEIIATEHGGHVVTFTKRTTLVHVARVDY